MTSRPSRPGSPGGSLKPIVAALGGDLYAGGRRASIPAPGHSPHDRSVSLLLLADGRVLAHSFGAADWREVLDDLRARGLIDAQGALVGPALGGAVAPATRPPGGFERRAVARRLWGEAAPMRPESPAARYCARRAVDPAGSAAIRDHVAAPLSVYRSGGARRAAMLAAIDDPSGGLTAVEVTYLTCDGRPARLRLPRKTVGVLPAGAAVRLAPAAPEMLVGEGVFTTLSAMGFMGLPGWALLAAGNLARWAPPDGVQRVVIAADRDAAGVRAAERLRHDLVRRGLAVSVRPPPAPFGDWNDFAQAEAEAGRKGGSGRPARGEGP